MLLPASDDRSFDRSPLLARLGHEFSNDTLLSIALRHRSWCAENFEVESNERLEFLGDAVLGMAVADHLYTTFPAEPEGQLAKIRAAVVSAPSLARIGADLGLGDHIQLGKGEDSSGGRAKPSILCDATEAVIGAVYLDAGWEPARALVVRLVADLVRDAAAEPGTDDAKTRLQELVARLGPASPQYHLTESGPDHEKRFEATVFVDGVAMGAGSGTSKKQAEQYAAREACALLATRVDDEATRA
jgi:ribonuclease-3